MFNAKQFGPKSNRRHANAPTYLSSDNLRDNNEEKSIRSSSHSIKGNQGRSGASAAAAAGMSQQQPMSDYKSDIQLNPITPSSMSARERVLKDKESKKRSDQMKHEKELNRIRQENQNMNQHAAYL